ncbi:hypothetical protein LTR50_007650 [Elasticomyces elasticus]|nr:hypothetical protein LTR50_007650 [Elasticomyces elasticus]
MNVELKRYADGTTRQLHDETASSGRYGLMVLASNDLLDPRGTSQEALQSCEKIIGKFPAGTIDLVVLQPLEKRFEWTDVPRCVKQFAEMRTHGLAKKEDAYKTYGIAKEDGAIVVARPDGYVGMLSRLTAPDMAEAYFRGCLLGV